MRPCPHLVFHAFLIFNLVLAANVARDVRGSYYSVSPHSSRLDDGRFAQVERLSSPETHEVSVRTVRRFLSAMKEIKVTVWLAHGALLGWYWGKKIPPWATDIHVHIHYDDLRFLAAYHNMTFYRDAKKRPSAEYLLDINPNFLDRSGKRDPENIIDAKWIDMMTGLYVNITAVSDVQKESEKGTRYLLTKGGHNYRKDSVMPLKVSKFEMEEVYIPRNASAILADEYGQDSLQRTTVEGYTFDPEMNQWKVVRPTAKGW